MWCLHFQAGFRGRGGGGTVRTAVERMDIEAGFAGSGALGEQALPARADGSVPAPP